MYSWRSGARFFVVSVMAALCAATALSSAAGAAVPKRVYFADGLGSRIFPFEVTSPGNLAAKAATAVPRAHNSFPVGLAMSADGKHIYTVAGGSIDGKSGYLS